eukprot:jgi/Antlo1/2242/1853
MRRFIRENLCVFLHVLCAETHCLNESDARDDIFFVFNDRLERAATRFRERTHDVFRRTMAFVDNIAPLSTQQPCISVKGTARALDSMLKMAYAIEALRKSADGSFRNGTRSLRLAINIVTMTCRFLNGRDELCSLSPLDLSWPYSSHYAKSFENDFHLPFDIENMAEFVVGQKIWFLGQGIRGVAGLDVDCLEMLLSYSFARDHGDDDVLREGEIEGIKVEAHAEAFAMVMQSVLGDSSLSERQKALVFSYVVMRYRGMAGHVDTTYFRMRPTYYYVYWIDHMRATRTASATRGARGSALDQ